MDIPRLRMGGMRSQDEGEVIFVLVLLLADAAEMLPETDDWLEDSMLRSFPTFAFIPTSQIGKQERMLLPMPTSLFNGGTAGDKKKRAMCCVKQV